MRRACAARRLDLPRAALVRLYRDEKKTMRQIAELYRCSLAIVRVNLQRAAIPSRSPTEWRRLRPRLYPDLTPENLQRRFVEENQSAKQIAARLGCHAVTVFRNPAKFEIKKKAAETLSD